MVKAGQTDPTLNLKPYVVPLPTHYNTNELPTYELGSLYVTKEVLWTFFEKWTTFIVVKLFVKKKPIFLDHPIISWTV